MQPAGIATFRWTPQAYHFAVDGAAVSVVIGVAGGTSGRALYHLDALTVLFTDP
jgi:CheY-specific phosphatase CheX